MKWGYLCILFLLVLVPAQAQDDQFDTWYFSIQIKAGQRFVWLAYNQQYEFNAEVPLDNYLTNSTLVVTQTPGDVDARAMIDDDYFDYYENGTQMIITYNPFIRDFYLKNYIIPTRYNETGNYFDWFLQHSNYSTKEGDFFHFSQEVNNTFGGFVHELKFIYYIPNGVLVYYSMLARDSATGEIMGESSEHLVYPNFTILVPTSNSTTSGLTDNRTSDQLQIGLPTFIITQTLFLMVIYKKKR